MGPGRVRPHLEEGRNAGTLPERKRIGSEDPAKPRIANRPLSGDSGTLLRVAGSHWPSVATDPEGQPTGYLEEPPGFCSDEILFGGRNRRNAMRGVFLV